MDMIHIMQTVDAYQHSAPTEDLLDYASLHNHEND